MKESQCHENSRLLAELDRLKKRYAVQNWVFGLIRWIVKIVSKLKFLVIILFPAMQGILPNNS